MDTGWADRAPALEDRAELSIISFQIDVGLWQRHEQDRARVRIDVVRAAGRRVEVVASVIPGLFKAHAPFENKHFLTRRVHMPGQAAVGLELEQNCAGACRGIASE